MPRHRKSKLNYPLHPKATQSKNCQGNLRGVFPSPGSEPGERAGDLVLFSAELRACCMEGFASPVN